MTPENYWRYDILKADDGEKDYPCDICRKLVGTGEAVGEGSDYHCEECAGELEEDKEYILDIEERLSLLERENKVVKSILGKIIQILERRDG